MEVDIYPFRDKTYMETAIEIEFLESWWSMNKLWKVGLFAKDSSYLEEALTFVIKKIADKGEEIISIKKSVAKFEIITNKSLYMFIAASDNARGYRWHEVFIFDAWTIDKEILDTCVMSQIIPFDRLNRHTWDYKKYIHYLEKNWYKTSILRRSV